MSSIGWRLIRPGSGKGAVLCLNFTVAGTRAQAGFTDLASELPKGYAVWGTDESAWPTAPGVPSVPLGSGRLTAGSAPLRPLAADAQLDTWLDHGCTVDTPVRAVFGFCATAPLAAALASRLACRLASGAAPPVVLFDPLVVGAQNMIDQTQDSLRQLAATAAAEELSTEDLPEGDLGALATRLVRSYATRAAAIGAARSINASTVTQLYTRLEAYLRYLALCAIAWSYPRVAPDLVVLSRDYEVPPELPGAPVVRLDVTQHKLLAQPEAARAAAQVLAGELVTGRS